MQEKKSYTRVFVGNIPYSSNERKVKEHMSRAGTVQSVELFLDEVGVSRGCGIIEYTNTADASKAIEILHHSRIEGRIITVKEDDSYSYGRRRFGNNCLKLRNLPNTVTALQLRDLGFCFGNVIRADITLDASGRSKGNGIIMFERFEDANFALVRLNRAIFNDREVLAFIESNENKNS